MWTASAGTHLGNLICVKTRHRSRTESGSCSPRIWIISALSWPLWKRRASCGWLPVGGMSLNVSQTRHVSFENGVQGVLVPSAFEARAKPPAMKHFYHRHRREGRGRSPLHGAAWATWPFTPTTASGWVSIGSPPPPWTTGWPARCWSACCKDLPPGQGYGGGRVLHTGGSGLPGRENRRLRRGAGRGHRTGRDRQRRYAGEPSFRP